MSLAGALQPGSVEPGGEAEAVLERLTRLYPRVIDLSLGRIEVLLGKLGNPERHLPPVIHVAGTNGKGSTCAFLRAMGEAAGWRVHVTISPHLVHLCERIRLAGDLVSETALAAMLAEIERVNDGAPVTVFEVLIACAYALFARVPAELAVVEVGLGGRFDATNVIAAPAACAITSISHDHAEFLGDSLAGIAWEKAGIMKPGRPVATGMQVPEVAAVLRRVAAETGAVLLERGRDWRIEGRADGLRFTDSAGSLDLPLPSLAGPHQVENAGIAIAAMRASGLALPRAACAGIAAAEWPARLQRLRGGLESSLPAGFELWLDGGHNEGAGVVLAAQLAAWSDRPVHLVVGMKQMKDAAGFLAPLLPHAATVQAVAEPGQHLALPVAEIIAASGGVAVAGPDIEGALARLAREAAPGRVLICGSLYLAGEVLRAAQTV